MADSSPGSSKRGGTAEAPTGDSAAALNSALSAMKATKACSVCGANLSGKKRFKDAGKYWCEPCWAMTSGRVQHNRFISAAELGRRSRARKQQLLTVLGLLAVLAMIYGIVYWLNSGHTP